MIAGRKFILDLLFIKCSVLRWEINRRQGVARGEGGGDTELPALPGGTQGRLGAGDAWVRDARWESWKIEDSAGTQTRAS